MHLASLVPCSYLTRRGLMAIDKSRSQKPEEGKLCATAPNHVTSAAGKELPTLGCSALGERPALSRQELATAACSARIMISRRQGRCSAAG